LPILELNDNIGEKSCKNNPENIVKGKCGERNTYNKTE
jgi:hypothetical protein